MHATMHPIIATMTTTPAAAIGLANLATSILVVSWLDVASYPDSGYELEVGHGLDAALY